ncbi:type I secretion system permease/ATPase [Halomonas sp. I1]|uniref:type I secretion system permease/ATPase n=1 Tax=Halomonas sp. I1 TaxID=393536 RepID=UPI0028DF3D2F|nr:type I secretion system permease/ATPase [Halomonas sp. I1]MDT8896595.1 type I secretion system permease/ATPase [Halomonas sp. I1]
MADTELESEQASHAESAVRDELLESLLTVARAHGHETNSTSLVAGLPLDEAGRLTPSVFARAATRAGMTAKIVKCRLTQLNRSLLPVVLLLEPGRSCVIVDLDLESGTARVVFPELGEAETRVDLEVLTARYSGQAIYVRPRFRFDARGEQVKHRKGRNWFWGVIRENRRLYRDVVLGSVMINLFALAMPLFVLNIYDRVVPNHATETLWVLAVGIFVVLCFDLGMRLVRSSFVDLAASRADVKLSSALMSKVMGLRLEVRPPSTGSFVSTLQSFESVRAFIGSATVVALVDLPFVLLFLAIVAIIGPALVIPLVVAVVVILLYALAAQSKLHDLSETSQRVSAQRNATLVESVSQLETVKSLRGESRVQDTWEKATAFLARTTAQLRMIGTSVTSVAQWTQQTASVCVIIIGVYLIIDGNLTQGGLIAAYMLTTRALAPVSQAAALLSQYHQSATALSSLDELMAQPEERPDDKAFIDRPVVQGKVRFDKLSFRYPGAEQDSLNGVSLTLKPGEKVALLGRVGCGKTTLQKLLLGLYQPTEGAVMVDGVDIRQFDPLQLRRHIGHVPQDVRLFYGSLKDNILAGAGTDGVDDDDLLRAIRISGLEELVNANPQGLDLSVGEGGQMLSGGQRQAVAIARAVVHDPSILLLDEPSSAMDHASEETLKSRLQAYGEGKTLVLVTHRTSLLSLVDRIVVMDAGRVMADGPPENILKALREGRIGRAVR